MPELRTISSLLVANRGEIACRVIRTCKKLGIRTIAVYSEADKDAVFVRQADEAYCIGAPAASESYLNMKKIIAVCKQAKADAVHPGYGFLSENGVFAAMCEENGINFIGPLPETMELLGNKAAVKNLLHGNKDVPLIPGYNGKDQSLPTLIKEATRIGTPILVKAAAGGGGKGMRVVDDLASLEECIDSVQREGKSSFGSDEVLLERYFRSCRHVEIQIFGDTHGTIIALGERDCSVQRRFQKVVEETPSPIMSVHPNLRKKMCDSAVAIGKLSNYIGAGTVEFLVEPDGRYFFLEVNTRLQVEHPITESIFGVDLVQWQIEVACGKKIGELKLLDGSFARADLPSKGYAVEVRLYAEDPSNNYFPCIGPLIVFSPFLAEGLRFDTGVESGSEISVHYDPMIAKVISYGPTRDIAIQRLVNALNKTMLAGVTSNKAFLVDVLEDEVFRSGKYDTGFLGLRFPEERRKKALSKSELSELSTVALLWKWHQRLSTRSILTHIPPGFTNGLRSGGKAGLVQVAKFRNKKDEVVLNYRHDARRQQQGRRMLDTPLTHYFDVQVNGGDWNEVQLIECVNAVGPGGTQLGHVTCMLGNARRTFRVAEPSPLSDVVELFVHSDSYGAHGLKSISMLASGKGESEEGGPNVLAPMPSKVVRVMVKVGDSVKQGQTLVVLESMKMEVKVNASAPGVVESIAVKQGQVIKDGERLMIVQPMQAKL